MRETTKSKLGASDIHAVLLEYKKSRKENFILVFSLIGILLTIGYGIYYLFYQQNYILFYLMMAGLFFYGLNIGFYQKFKKMDIFSALFNLISILVIFTNLICCGFQIYDLLWLFLIPITAFYSMGLKTGVTIVISIFVLIICIYFLNELQIIKTEYTPGLLFNLFNIFLINTIMITFYELTTHKSENIILHQIFLDTLTGFPNRNQLNEDMKNLQNYYMVLINIDEFKIINSLYGSKIGDLTLLEISRRLKTFFYMDKVYKIYKLNADEFLIVLLNISNKKDVEFLANQIYYLLIREYNIKNFQILINITMGISNSNEGNLYQADIALKVAKQNKKPHIIYTKELNDNTDDHFSIKNLKNLNEAIVNDNIIPYFQPIVNNHNEQIEEYECLARLIVNEEIIAPLDFIDLSKKIKIYPHITKMILLKSFEYFKNKNYLFSINLSVDDLLNEDTKKFLFTLLDTYQISERLIIELVESEKIIDNDDVQNFISEVKRRNCKIAIDDFGTGYSNFEYILKMKVDIIKLDASLIKNIDRDKNSEIIAETIVNFTKKLDIKTIAEYVHSEDVYRKVKELKIDYSQGYFLGKPRSCIV